jgi:hypothetical protein
VRKKPPKKKKDQKRNPKKLNKGTLGYHKQLPLQLSFTTLG